MEEKIAYFNDLIVKFEEIFYQELSNVAHPKVEFIGTDFLKSRKIEGDTIEKVVDSCIKEIKAAGLIGDLTYTITGSGLLLILSVKDCIHLPMEAKLKEGFRKGGVAPYLCPIANMILDRILNLLNYEMVYNAQMEDIDVSKGECRVKCAIYESMEKVGQVGDWKSA